MVDEGYRMGAVRWSGFETDLHPVDMIDMDRRACCGFCAAILMRGFTVDWDQLESCENERLLTSLSMICPFDVAEKQALLEAPSMADRAQLLTAILEMAVHSEEEDGGARH